MQRTKDRRRSEGHGYSSRMKKVAGNHWLLLLFLLLPPPTCSVGNQKNKKLQNQENKKYKWVRLYSVLCFKSSSVNDLFPST